MKLNRTSMYGLREKSERIRDERAKDRAQKKEEKKKERDTNNVEAGEGRKG